MRWKDVLILGTLAIAALYGGYLFLRAEYGLGSGWTDGNDQYSDLHGERIRYAVWRHPEPLLGGVNGWGPETRPAISPDGRFLVFASGARGLNADLFVAEWRNGDPTRPRALLAVNSTSDELAPAFGPDALYFATDRGGAAYGLDLWRVPYADGEFGIPEPLPPGINTAADETDPSPGTRRGELYFASDRPRGARTDFDLYVATLEAELFVAEERAEAEAPRWSVSPLATLNTPFDDREPALFADGRSLYFASDRAGTRGGFDLFRSLREDETWLPPHALDGINSERSERSPMPSADGFSLLFGLEAPGVPSDIWRARSVELFRVPPAPISLRELLLLAALLALAILGFLAKRWRTMEIIYRALLLSLLVHLFLLWYLRAVYPESSPTPTDAPEDTFRVRLAAPELTAQAAPDGNDELRQRAAENASPRRLNQESAREELAPSANPLLAESAPADPAWQTRSARRDPQRTSDSPSELRDVETRTSPSQESAPDFEVASERSAPDRTPNQGQSPTRSTTTPSTERAPTPAIAAARIQSKGPRADDPARSAAGPTRELDVRGPTTRAVQETFEVRSDVAPSLALPNRQEAPARPTQGPRDPNRARTASEPAAALTPQTTGDVRTAAVPRPPANDSSRERVRRSTSFEPTRATELRAEQAPDATPVAEAAPRFEPLSRLEPVRAEPRMADGNPQRSTHDPIGDPEAGGASPAPRLDAPRVATPTPDAWDTDRGDRTQVAAKGSITPTTRVRSGQTADGPRESAAAPERFDGTRGLALASSPRRRSATGPGGPRRRQASPTGAEPRPETPAARAVEIDEPQVSEAIDVPRRTERTPYRNRYGEEKLRALEEFGGSAETERAVAAGLTYLAGKQNNSGSWGDRGDFHDKYGDVRVGKTGLALLAFLGAGHTHQSSSEFSPVVGRALEYLLEVQEERSGHFGNTSAYSHGIAAYALAECYAITADRSLRPALERAIAAIERRQDRRNDARLFGGWGYYYRNNRVWNGDRWPRVSITAWQVMALESARLGGLEIEKRVFDDAREFLLAAWDRGRGAFRYSHDPNRLNSGYPILPASTPAALFALSLLGVDIRKDELEPARHFVLERRPREYRYRGDDDFVFHARGNLYFWYYGTLAMFRHGGSAWRRWNVAMKDTLLEAQSNDGSWRPLSVYTRFAGDEDDQRVYTTALAVLTLEIYYRYFTPLLAVDPADGGSR